PFSNVRGDLRTLAVRREGFSHPDENGKILDDPFLAPSSSCQSTIRRRRPSPTAQQQRKIPAFRKGNGLACICRRRHRLPMLFSSLKQQPKASILEKLTFARHMRAKEAKGLATVQGEVFRDGRGDETDFHHACAN
ncbi:hypothetical protein, partial [Sulfitobacter sp.]|uniref:hypothetical protein n=1 Tax=Sulfitobacter sp. TaxID=1903071 RepID=UPI003298B572